jgi:hypothetical protein
VSRVASENEVKIQIILSRKGADSSTGPGIGASPVFDDGSFVSIPIPYSHSPVKYSDIQFQKSEPRLSGLIEQLFGNEFAETPAHLDPDLVFASRRDRHKNWVPAFGQASSAQTHLANHGVGIGDLFLFYGRFKKVSGPPWRFKNDPDYKNGDFQAVWGWLRVGERIDLGRENIPEGNADHPHAYGRYVGKNVLYRAATEIGLKGMNGVPGGGVLPRLRPLTRRNASASVWQIDRDLFSKHRQEHVANSEVHAHVLEIAYDFLSDLQTGGGEESQERTGPPASPM